MRTAQDWYDYFTINYLAVQKFDDRDGMTITLKKKKFLFWQVVGVFKSQESMNDYIELIRGYWMEKHGASEN